MSMLWALIPNWLKYSIAALVAAFLLLAAGYVAGKRDGRSSTETKIEILKQKLSYQKDKILIEAGDALIGLENALKRLSIIKEEVVVAEDLARAEKTRFDLGDSTLLIVNLREQAAAEVGLRLVGAEVDYWVARADYDAVLMRNLRKQ